MDDFDETIDFFCDACQAVRYLRISEIEGHVQGHLWEKHPQFEERGREGETGREREWEAEKEEEEEEMEGDFYDQKKPYLGTNPPNQQRDNLERDQSYDTANPTAPPSHFGSNTERSDQEQLDEFCLWMASRETQVSRRDIERAVSENKINLNAVDSRYGKTPLAFAAVANLHDRVRVLIEIRHVGADVNYVMPDGRTVLWVVLENDRYDYTEMIRLLLAKGANPNFRVHGKTPIEVAANITMRYWLRIAMQRNVASLRNIMENYSKIGLANILEMEFGAIGQTFALKRIIEAISGHVSHRIDRKPLVLFLPGPPGHGKTYTIRNLAHAIVGADNFHFVPCGTVKDDADLWGSNIGGARGSRSQLTIFLEERQGRRSMVVFDEFEKIHGLTNPFGWDQGRKIYQTMLEPFQEGHLSAVEYRDDGVPSSRIDCSETIFICTSNLCQKEIISFFEGHEKQLNKRNLSDADMGFIRSELCEKILRKELMRFFKDIDPELQALARRFDHIIPYVPFTSYERHVVADNGLRSFFSHYRDPPKGNRLTGNSHVMFTRDVREYIVDHYDPMQGVSALYNQTKFINEIIVTKTLNCVFVPSESHDDPSYILVSMEGRDMRASPPKEGIAVVSKMTSRPSKEQLRDDKPDVDSEINMSELAIQTALSKEEEQGSSSGSFSFFGSQKPSVSSRLFG